MLKMKKLIYGSILILSLVGLCKADDAEFVYKTKKLKLVRLLKARKYDDAIENGFGLLKYTRKYFASDSDKIAKVCGLLGDCYMKKQVYDRAEVYYQRYVAEIRKKGSISSLKKGLRKLMRMYAEKSDYEKAVHIAEEIYEIDLDHVGGRKNTLTGNNLITIAAFHGKLKNYKAARSFYFRALGICKSLGNRGDVMKSEIYRKLAQDSRALGDYDAAAMYYIDSIGLKKKLTSGADPAIGSMYREIARIYLKERNFQLAQKYMTKAMVFHKGTDNTSKLSEAMMDLAGVYYLMKDYRNTEYYIKKAAVIWEKKEGKYHPKVAYYLEKLGFFYRNMKDYKRSKKYLDLADEIRNSAAWKDVREEYGK